MARWWSGKLKGIAGLGAIGGAIGAVLGGAWYAITGLLSGAFFPAVIANAAVVWGLFGAFSVASFAALLASVGAKKSLEDINVAWSALVGGAAGAVFPVAFSIVMSGSLVPLYLIDRFLPIMGMCGAFGAVLTSGMVVMAKKSHRNELASADDVRSLPG